MNNRPPSTHCGPCRAAYAEVMGGRRASQAGFAVVALGIGAACLLLLNSTTAEPPSPALADEIDRLLVRDSCINSIEDWSSREYAWGRNLWTGAPVVGRGWLGSDRTRVSVSFRQGQGAGNYPPGRTLIRADQVEVHFDSSPEGIRASAEYDVRARRLTDFDCGPTYPPEEPQTGGPL